MMIAKNASSIVAGNRVVMTRMTGSVYLNERPKSPLAADFKNSQILDVKRLIQAPAFFGLATSAALVSSPRSSSVGSPGAA